MSPETLRKSFDYDRISGDDHSFGNLGDSSFVPVSVTRFYKWTERTRLRFQPPLLPIVEFPNQGCGQLSEFNQRTPLWSKQPFKALYVVYFFGFLILLYLPCRAVSSILRSGRGLPEWSWSRSMAVWFMRRMLWFMCQTRIILTPQPPVNHEPHVKYSVFTWVPAIDPDAPNGLIKGDILRAMRIQNTVIQRTSGFWYSVPRNGSPVGNARAAPGEPVLYHLHGGAYWLGTSSERSPVAQFVQSLLARLAPYNAPSRAFCLESRLAEHGKPEKGSYPGALLDALAGYVYLVNDLGFQPAKITIMGDSSGGNLALALTRYLRDEMPHLVPGSMLLVSPWCDISRSHSGPLSAPNPFSTTVLNCRCDIIDPSILYRNTAVSAFLGKLPASETYTNPYISPVSLHLDAAHGGRDPHWGFNGFPARIYIVTGGAELSYEQHVTLAHRLAEGTHARRPVYVGDLLSATDDYHEYSSRCRYPRSSAASAHHIKCMHTDDIPAAVLESREVVLDEERSGFHVFPLFTCCEPERTRVLERISRWIVGIHL